MMVSVPVVVSRVGGAPVITKSAGAGSTVVASTDVASSGVGSSAALSAVAVLSTVPGALVATVTSTVADAPLASVPSAHDTEAPFRLQVPGLGVPDCAAPGAEIASSSVTAWAASGPLFET